MTPATVGAIPGVAAAGPVYAPAASAARATTLGAAPRRPVGQGQLRRAFSQSIADYSYVPGDLRRIGLLAAGLVVLLIALSFFVR